VGSEFLRSKLWLLMRTKMGMKTQPVESEKSTRQQPPTMKNIPSLIEKGHRSGFPLATEA